MYYIPLALRGLPSLQDVRMSRHSTLPCGADPPINTPLLIGDTERMPR